jgi:hypothetical protein
MDIPTWEDCGNLLLKHFGAVYWAARSWYPRNEDFIAVLLQHFFDTAPVGDF